MGRGVLPHGVAMWLIDGLEAHFRVCNFTRNHLHGLYQKQPVAS